MVSCSVQEPTTRLAQMTIMRSTTQLAFLMIMIVYDDYDWHFIIGVTNFVLLCCTNI